jgi:4-amino-4-deoxy-L-arabinose transferase-like glycosyltransferase
VSRRRPREIHRPSWTVADAFWRSAPLLILGLHGVLALLYNWATPFGNNGYANTPDEGAHFQYVAYVARAWRLPRFEGYAGVGYEAHQPPLYYFLAALLYHLTGGEGKGVRLLSTLASAGVVWLTWLTLRRLLPHRPEVALVGMGFVAFLPMHLAIGSAVGNDALTNLLFASVLYGLLAMGSVGLGVLVGLALLTKATAILLLPVVAMGLLLKAQRSGAGWRAGVRQAGIACGIALLIGSWWFLRNALLYDDPLLQKTFLNVFAGTAKAEDFLKLGMSRAEYARLVADWTFRSFWFAYGTPRTAHTGVPNFLPDRIYLVLAIWQLMVLVGFVRILRERSGSFSKGGITSGRGEPKSVSPGLQGETQEEGLQNWLWTALFTFLLVLVSFVLFVRIFFQAQGRYFYPALVPIAVFNALGWDGLLPPRWRLVGHFALLLFWLLLSIGCMRYLG